MLQLQGAPYRQNATYTVITEIGDDGKEIALDVDVLIVTDGTSSLKLPANPGPGHTLKVINGHTFPIPVILDGNGHLIAPGVTPVPPGTSSELTFAGGIWFGEAAAAIAGDAPAVRAFRSTDQAIPGSVLTPIVFNQTRFNGPGPALWIVGQPNRLTAALAGRYQVTGNITWQDAGAGSLRALIIRKNGIALVDQVLLDVSATPAPSCAQNVTTLVALNASDYVELIALHDEVTLNVIAAPELSPEFMMVKV